jgi:hypothetical protein
MPDTKCANGMTCKRYSTGGFALHKIILKGRPFDTYSAWYDREGYLLGAEGFDGDGWSAHVTAGFAVWNDLVRLGKVWKEKETL